MNTQQRTRVWRPRFAAIGAALAVSFGAGGLYIGHAASTPGSSTFVAITPVRVLDTRSNLGLTGVFTSPTSRDLLVAGSIATADGVQVVVPEGATAVSMNVTVVSPSAQGFLAVRPADATGAPSTSNLNFVAGQVIPNAVTVKIPTSGADAGKIEITYSAGGTTGPTTNVLVDIVGYYLGTGTADGDPCTADGLDGTIISGHNGDGDITLKCFRNLVTTFAGDGSASTGDGALGQLLYPQAVAVDAAGNLYVADAFLIRKITPAGVITTLAGSTKGFADGTGAAAQFGPIAGLAVDTAGNVYAADNNNHRIRKITPAGVVTTLAGDGTPSYADGPGAAAHFLTPWGVAVDAAGNVYVGDAGNNRIRKITPAGDVTTLAGQSDFGTSDGTGSEAHFNAPFGVAVDAVGNVYVTDHGNHRIRKITPAGVVTTTAGSSAGFADGTGTDARFDEPDGIAVDSAGNLYIADVGNHRIRKITPAGVVTTIAGSTPGYLDGQGTSAQFNGPQGVAVDSAGNLYVSDSDNYRIRQIN
ncbi:hypothetical protein BH10ACT2_BH10ACT2_10620 [soil metagenome]